MIKQFVVSFGLFLLIIKTNASNKMYMPDIEEFLNDDLNDLNYDDSNFDDIKSSARYSMKDDVFFTLYTQDSALLGAIIKPSLESIQQSQFDPSKVTKIITHGYLSSGQSDVCQGIKNEYLKNHDFNVIIVDWSYIAGNPIYFVPVLNTKTVGEFYGSFVEMLIEYGADPKKFHFIGHSLGAHISGFAGDAVNVTKGKIGRVTGLDPALPSFGVIQLAQGRISTTAADFVDIIHSNGGVAGIYDPIGHADFYPNGGTMPQPGCELLNELNTGCSHGRSYEFFKESINGIVKFTAYSCASYADFMKKKCTTNVTEMGEYVSLTAKGSYYLKTNSQPVFAQGNTGL